MVDVSTGSIIVSHTYDDVHMNVVSIVCVSRASARMVWVLLDETGRYIMVSYHKDVPIVLSKMKKIGVDRGGVKKEVRVRVEEDRMKKRRDSIVCAYQHTDDRVWRPVVRVAYMKLLV